MSPPMVYFFQRKNVTEGKRIGGCLQKSYTGCHIGAVDFLCERPVENKTCAEEGMAVF